MKTKKMLYTMALIAALCSCSRQTDKIDYLPCKVDKNEDWGFVDNKGKILYQDMFKAEPSTIVEGLFHVQENKDYPAIYTLYRFNKKQPVSLIEDLVSVGKPSDGVLPVCRKGAPIEIINLKGKTLFILEEVNGQRVISCEPTYRYGYLVVRSEDSRERYHYSVVDKKGNIVLKPEYGDIKILSDNLFYVREEDGDMEWIFVNAKGERQTQWKEIDIDCVAEKYIAAERNDRRYIYDLGGREILKCSADVGAISQIEGKYFVYYKDGKSGLMNFDGEKILSAKYNVLQILKNGNVLARRDYNSEYEVLDIKGNHLQKLSNYNDGVIYLDGFGCIGGDADLLYILDEDFKPAGKTELYYIGSSDYSWVYSDACNTSISTTTDSASGAQVEYSSLPAQPAENYYEEVVEPSPRLQDLQIMQQTFYSGKIDNKYPIHITFWVDYGRIEVARAWIAGEYYYDKQGKNNTLLLTEESYEDNHLILSEENSKGKTTGWFYGDIYGGVYEGTYVRASDSKQMPFRVTHESYNDGSFIDFFAE